MKSLNKLLIIILLGFLTTGTIFAVLIYPSLNQVHNVYVEAGQKQTDLQTLLAQILAYKNARADLNSISDQNKVLDRILPRENLQVAIAEIESAANTTGMAEALTIDEHFDKAGKPVATSSMLKNEDLAVEVGYTMTISGPFLSMIQFIQYLEHLPHFTEISKISLSSVTVNTSKPGLTEHGININGAITGVFLVRKKSP